MPYWYFCRIIILLTFELNYCIIKLSSMKKYLFFFCIGFAVLSHSQDKLNQFDSAGKKQGTWIVYLNNNWTEVNDSSKASFSRYTYCEDGRNMHPMGHCDKNWKFVHIGGNDLKSGRIKLLDGVYTWTDNNGKTRCKAEFNNGECLYFKWFYPSGAPQSDFDYTKKWKDQPHSYSVSEYDKKGGVKSWYYGKNGNIWGGVPKDGI